MKLYLKVTLGLPTTFANSTAEESALLNAIAPKTTDYDCTGRESNMYRSSTTFITDPTSFRAKHIYVPGNQAGCLSAKKCT